MRLMRRIGLLPLSTLFPYTTLFRSHDVVVVTGRVGSQFVGLLRAAAAARPHRHVQGTGPRGVEVEAELAPREASRVTLQRRVTPALPAVGGHLHRLDAGAAVPRLAAELHPLPAPQARTRDVAGDE